MNVNDNSSNIKFSICIPVYNVEKYLYECIQSVLEQTYSNFEVILIDDGSTDMSGNICDDFALYDDRIQVYHKLNEGLLLTRRYSLKVATGEFIVFLDSDDSLDKNALETFNRYVNSYKPDCIIYGIKREMDDGSTIITTEDELVYLENRDSIYEKVLMNSAYNSLCRKVIKRKLLLDDQHDYNLFKRLNLGEDKLQSLEVYKKAKGILFITESLYNYRLNENSITKQISIDDYKDLYKVKLETAIFIDEQRNAINGNWLVKYYVYCLNQFINDIINICNIKTDVFNKIDMLECLYNDRVYKGYLKNYNYKGTLGIGIIPYILFKNRYFHLLLRYSSLVKIMGKLRTVDK